MPTGLRSLLIASSSKEVTALNQRALLTWIAMKSTLGTGETNRSRGRNPDASESSGTNRDKSVLPHGLVTCFSVKIRRIWVFG